MAVYEIERTRRMYKMKKPETIENRWDILYRDYPEVYEVFSLVKRRPEKDFGKMLHVKD